MLISRIFAVLAASLLVLSFALLLLLPWDMALVQAVLATDPTLLMRLKVACVSLLGGAVWSHVITPVLARPVWLMPISLGMICVGVATTLHAPAAPRRTRRRS